MRAFVARTVTERENVQVRRVVAALRTVVIDLRAAVFHGLVNVAIGSSLVPRHLRQALYRVAGFNIRSASLSPHLIFRTNKVVIGSHVYINERCSFDNIERIEIGDWVHVGPEVHVSTTSHEVGNAVARAGQVTGAPVVVAAGCWIGARVVLLPGVTVGEGCVVAAGAVVTEDCRPHGLYAGVPARRVRDLSL